VGSKAVLDNIKREKEKTGRKKLEKKEIQPSLTAFPSTPSPTTATISSTQKPKKKSQSRKRYKVKYLII
jgi:hypothetical protein